MQLNFKTESTFYGFPEFEYKMKCLSLIENQNAHFETKLSPDNDPDLIVEWFHNGQPLLLGSRITTFNDFGFVALDINQLKISDTGTYTCKATNQMGEAICSVDLIVNRAQETTEPPRFVAPLHGTKQSAEWLTAQFECQIEPFPDGTMTVEWFHNGEPLMAGSRFQTIFEFGYAALRILSLDAKDQGDFTIKVTNACGSIASTANLQVKSKGNVILESQYPQSLHGIDYLEDRRPIVYHESESNYGAPKFLFPLKDKLNLRENETVYQQTQVIPNEDPDLKIEWYKDNEPLTASSRIQTLSDFGNIVLEIKKVSYEDSGIYTVKASNKAGESAISCRIQCEKRINVVKESQLPFDTIERISHLEGSQQQEEDFSEKEYQIPKFINTSNDLSLREHQYAHFESRLVPFGDPTLNIEWFFNGGPLLNSSRIRTLIDFGFIVLEIADVCGKDSGIYQCKATNKRGEDTITFKLDVKEDDRIVMDSQLLGSKIHTDVDPKIANSPKFVTQIQDVLDKFEGGSAQFDCRVEPFGEDTPQVEWYFNGNPLIAGKKCFLI